MTLDLPYPWIEDEAVQGNFDRIKTEWPQAIGNWTDYTPAVTGSTFVIGDGTIAGRYIKIGRKVTVDGSITFGSTTSLSGTASRISLPFAAASRVQYGIVKAYDNSPGNYAFGFLELGSGLAYGIPWMVAGTTTTWATMDATAPWTWAQYDNLYWQITYETAV